MKTLDIEAVRAFVLVAELRNFTRAAEALDMTQSAVSLKIKRLEEEVGRRLLERTPRRVSLSAEGGLFLEPARQLVQAHQGALGCFGGGQRRLVIGISPHILGAELPALLARMSQTEPGLTLELRVARSNTLLQDFGAGGLDAALVLGHDDQRRDGEAVLTEHFGWMGGRDFAHQPGTPLRLAAQAAPCSVRSMALAALDAAGISWTEAFVGDGVATIGAAISAGLAVAALGRRVAPAGVMDLGPRLGLPPLPSREVMLYSSLTDVEARRALRALAAAIRGAAGI